MRNFVRVWVLGLVLGAGILASTSIAIAGGGHSEVRVLLYEGKGPIVVGHPESASEISLAEAGELFVPGQGMLRSYSPVGRGPWKVGKRTVRGRISVHAKRGRIRVLNRVGLEDYVASTVGGEMMASWPREALRAQAVAARTYVLHEADKRGRSSWDVQATTASQVYRGVSAETPETRAATRSTSGQVLTYLGEPILAVFHSTAGGRTEAAGDVWGEDRPYLRVLDVEDEDDAPHTYWRTSISGPDLQALLDAADLSVGVPREIEVTARTRGGRVKRLTVHGSDRAVDLAGGSLRALVGGLDLRSRLFEVRAIDDGFAFVGSGYGHGVGMSQWGARAMARRGDSYQHILETFYPGSLLETWQPERLADRGPVHHSGLRSDGFAGE